MSQIGYGKLQSGLVMGGQYHGLVSVQPLFDSNVWFYENHPPSLFACHIHTPIYIQAVVHSAMGHSQHKCGAVYVEHNNAHGAVHYACDRPSAFATNYRNI